MSIDDDETTTTFRRPVELDDFEALLEAREERDELLEHLSVPSGIEAVAFATLLAALYQETIRRAGLERADPSAVALMATPQGLLTLACGGQLDPGNPLGALLRPSASA